MVPQLSFYNNKSSFCPLYSNNVSAIIADRNGFIWIGYAEGIMDKLDASGGKVLYRTNVFQQYLTTSNVEYSLFVDTENELWIYSDKIGLYYYQPSSNSLLSLNEESKKGRLNNNIIRGIAQDDAGKIWIATDHGGINIINKKDFSVRYITNNENDDKSWRLLNTAETHWFYKELCRLKHPVYP